MKQVLFEHFNIYKSYLKITRLFRDNNKRKNEKHGFPKMFKQYSGEKEPDVIKF